MSETTQINKFRQKRLKRLSKKASLSNNDTRDTYMYPKQNLYSRQEFELLDSIYSDEEPIASTITKEKELESGRPDNFWPQNKEEILRVLDTKSNFFPNIKWFLIGVMSTSVIWLIYFQLNMHEIKTKSDTQIIFQKATQIVTDKTIDGELTKKLNGAKASTEPASKQDRTMFWDKLFSKSKGQVGVVAQNTKMTTTQIRYHTVVNGDSFWLIANKYYSSPSQQNINKIMKANNIKRITLLKIGQKLVIPE